jgi:hypothetical protein
MIDCGPDIESSNGAATMMVMTTPIGRDWTGLGPGRRRRSYSESTRRTDRAIPAGSRNE